MTTPSLDDLLASLPGEEAGDETASGAIEEGWEDEPGDAGGDSASAPAPSKPRRRGFALTPRRAFGLLAIVLALAPVVDARR